MSVFVVGADTCAVVCGSWVRLTKAFAALMALTYVIMSVMAVTVTPDFIPCSVSIAKYKLEKYSGVLMQNHTAVFKSPKIISLFGAQL